MILCTLSTCVITIFYAYSAACDVHSYMDPMYDFALFAAREVRTAASECRDEPAGSL